MVSTLDTPAVGRQRPRLRLRLPRPARAGRVPRMDIDLALLADAATIDGSGKLNILGVFDRISASAFPAQHGRMAMVLRFSAGLPEAGPHAVGIRLSGPDGQELLRLDGE